MKQKMPTVGEFMTRSPIAIPHDQPLSLAEQTMRDKGVRHLPVTENGRLVGLLSQRNVRAALLTRAGAAFLAKDAMVPDPFVTTADTPLDVVANTMAEDKYGSVVLMDSQKNILGIFTTVDACRALRQLLQDTHV